MNLARLRPRTLRTRLTILATVGAALLVAAVSMVVSLADQAHIALALLMPPVLVVLAIGSWLLVGAVLRPVNRLASEARRLSMSSTGARLPVPSVDGDEMAQLVQSLNAMLDRVEQALVRERTFVDDASHELRTPLSILRGEVELAQLSLTDFEGTADETHLKALRASLASVQEEAERLSRLSEDLLVLARLDEGGLALRRRAINVRWLAGDVCDRLGREPPHTWVEGDEVLVNADPGRLEQVLTNLVANARRHALGRVRIRVTDLAERGAEIEVADDGPGFPPHLLESAFERFTRADASRGRSRHVPSSAGLGLAITAGVVRAHGGRIEAANGGDLGCARVTIRLPL
jgi:signal transduction histidine kinase